MQTHSQSYYLILHFSFSFSFVCNSNNNNFFSNKLQILEIFIDFFFIFYFLVIC